MAITLWAIFMIISFNIGQTKIKLFAITHQISFFSM